MDVIRGRHAWLHRARKSMKDFVLYDVWKSDYVMNLVCLFPALEHLQLALSSFDAKVVECDALPLVSPTLKSLALVCPNSVLPASCEWKHFMEWIHHQHIYGINTLFIVDMVSRDIEAVEGLLKIQGSSVKHLHVRKCEFLLSSCT